MVNINKNKLFSDFENIIKNSEFQYKNIPKSFISKESEAIDIFKKRILFEKTIEEAVSFNRKLNWGKDTTNLFLIENAEELVEVFKLRSNVYSSLNYGKEFPDLIDGLNFDSFDNKSAIVYYKNEGDRPTGTVRLIFDSPLYTLPTEEKISFNCIRKQFTEIGEISRIIVDSKKNGLNQEFKYLMRGIYNIFINNDIDIAVSVIKSKHLKLYKKLGGVDVLNELSEYGALEDAFSIISYNPLHASDFFKKVFLNIKKV